MRYDLISWGILAACFLFIYVVVIYVPEVLADIIAYGCMGYVAARICIAIDGRIER